MMFKKSLVHSLSTLALFSLLSACVPATQPGAAPAQPAAAEAAGEIKIGALATLEGPFAVLGEDGIRGIELAIAEFGGTIHGKKITLIKESTDATPDKARDMARKLVEQENVDIVIGPLSGDEGLAIRDYAKTQPTKTFLNGTSAAQDTTLREPAPNFYRFSTDGTQWMAGLGTYAYDKQGYKKVVTIGEDYSFPYSQVGGFMIEFCRAGGKVTNKYWVPIGTSDFSSIISTLPTDIDAIYVALGGADAINFLKQYEQFGGKAALIGGTITVDQSALSSGGDLAKRVVGIASAGPIADSNDDAAWQGFVAAYKKQFADGFPSPSLFAHGYYVNTKAALLALQQVEGDLSDDQVKFRAALDTLEFDSPTGLLKIDKNRNAIANIYVTEVQQQADGTLLNKLVQTIPNVTQTLGEPEEKYLALGSMSRENPSCE